ncbi:MAG: cytochrome c [Gemmatimonadota bacterium]
MSIGRALRTAGLVIVAGIVLFALFVVVQSGRALSRKYPVPAIALAVPTDSTAIARGEHLVQAVGACATCHDADLGGKVYAEMGPVGVVAGPNLTRGQGGRGAGFVDADWIRALRVGAHRDSTSLLMMPSEVYTNFSDADIGAIVAYLKQLKPVDREIITSYFKPLGRTLLAVGALDILSAPKTTARITVPEVLPTEEASYGRYLVEAAGCAGCHGPGLSGGAVAGPPGLPPAANLTPAGLGKWTEADFIHAIREGKRPGGTAINPFMPWESYRGMTDSELRAIWHYLQSVPSRAFGGR